MGTRRLVVDIGTNSVLALLAEVSGGRLHVISDRKKTTRLGEGHFSNGLLGKAAMQRTAEAVIQFVKSSEFDQIFLIGTAALRLAGNASEFNKIIYAAIGEKPIIVSGVKEAELSFLGACFNLNLRSDNILLIDVGGGSTELVLARSGEVSRAVSINIGALRLKEQAGGKTLKFYIAEARKAVEKEIIGLKIPPELRVIAVGGTITSTVAIRNGTAEYNVSSIHGSVLTAAEMRTIAINFEKTDIEGRRRLIPFDPERAGLILPGLGIFLALLGILGQESLTVSTGGIRFGAALFPDKLLT